MSIDFSQFGRLKVQLENEAALRTLGLIQYLQEQLLQQSPVRSGKFRANWQIGAGAPKNTILESTIQPEKFLGPVKLSKNYYFSNNVPYAINLANGYSKQAAAGWIELIVENAKVRGLPR